MYVCMYINLSVILDNKVNTYYNIITIFVLLFSN